MPFFGIGAVIAWLGAAWTTLSAFVVSALSIRFLVSAAYVAAFIAIWVTFTAVLNIQISSISYTATSTHWATLISYLSFLKPPNLTLYISAIITGYISMILFKATSKVLSGIAST
jgi:hypothetical protein